MNFYFEKQELFIEQCLCIANFPMNKYLKQKNSSHSNILETFSLTSQIIQWQFQLYRYRQTDSHGRINISSIKFKYTRGFWAFHCSQVPQLCLHSIWSYNPYTLVRDMAQQSRLLGQKNKKHQLRNPEPSSLFLLFCFFFFG